MSSTVPLKPLEISLLDFPSRSVAFLDEILQFGLPGQEIITSTNLRPIEPDIASAEFARDAGVLTTTGSFQYQRACTKFDKYVDSQQLLLAYIISALSPASKSLLETRTGPDGYAASKATHNTLRLWQLIVETHMGSSMRAKHSALVNFMQHKQQPGQSFPEFISIFRRDAATITSYFGAAAPHAGFILIDMLLRVLLVNNVDPVYFARQKERALEEFPAATTDELIALFQQHVVEAGPHLTSAQFVGRGLAASTISSAEFSSQLSSNHQRRIQQKVRSSGPPGSLGPFDPARAKCSSCWDKGYIHTKHTHFDCPFTSSKPKSPSKAFVVTTDSTVPSSTALVVRPTASTPIVSDIDSARIFAERFETEGFAAYAKAMKTLGRDADIPSASFFPCIVGADSLHFLDDVLPSTCVITPTSPLPLTLIGSSSFFPDTYYDNAASVSLVKHLSLLSNSRFVDKPFRIGGLSSGALVTHMGDLSFLPAPLQRCYFSNPL